MKYRLKKDLLWLKSGEILKTATTFSGTQWIAVDSVAGYSLRVDPLQHPDFFEQVNEEDEKDQEAIKRLESRGAMVIWPDKLGKVKDVLNPPKKICEHKNSQRINMAGGIGFGRCKDCSKVII